MRCTAFLVMVAASAGLAAADAEPLDAMLQAATADFAGGRYAEAMPRLRALSLRDVPAADTMLGVMAVRGVGCATPPCRADAAVGAAWFMRAARRNYGPAQLALADAYARGRGVPVNWERARGLALAAAEHGQQAGARVLLARLAAARRAEQAGQGASPAGR